MIICTCSSIVQHCLFYQSSECHLRSIVYLGFERPLHAATVLRSVQHPGREPLIFYTNADPYALSRLLLPVSRSGATQFPRMQIQHRSSRSHCAVIWHGFCPPRDSAGPIHSCPARGSMPTADSSSDMLPEQTRS